MRHPLARLAGVAGLAAVLAGCGTGEATVSLPDDLRQRSLERGAYVKPLGAAVRLEPAREDRAYLRSFLTTYTSMTPENAMKWEVVQPERGEFDFSRADALVDAARRAGKRVRGHTLVWDRQLPGWLEDGDFSPEELREILVDHVRTVVRHYRGKVEEWDVVNEPLRADGSFKRSLWFRAFGPDFVAIAFRAAREADPDAVLFLNETGAELPGPKAQALRELARDLVADGVPIDGIGLESHLTIDAFPTTDELLEELRRYDEIGLATAITELDVALPPERSEDPAALRRQAEAYGEVSRACAEAESCTGLTVWGVTDDWSWRPRRDPLPIDEGGEPKPALDPLLDAFRG